MAVVAPLAWFLIVVTRGWGGRDPHVLSIGALLLTVAVVVIRPARVLPRPALLLAVALSVAAFVVALFAPTGWAGAPSAASYVCMAWLALVTAAWVRRRPAALELVAGLVMVAGAIEFAEAWLPWWGGQDPTRPMFGTFYWHDPYAAFLLPGAVLGLWFWVRKRRVLGALGLFAFAICASGIVYSTSRAVLACLVLGVALFVTAGAVASGRLVALTRSAIAVVFAAAVTLLISGPPFFPHRATAVAAMQARTAGQSLGQNGGYRLQFWSEALHLFARHPLIGGGYRSLATLSEGHVPQHWAISPFAHNGYLQALAAGGLLLGIPFLTGCLAIAVITVRNLVRGARHRRLSLGEVALPLCLGLVMLHSAVDFDWAYPANKALFGVLAGALLGHWLTVRGSDKPALHTTSSRPLVASLAAIGVLSVAAWSGWAGEPHESLPVKGVSVAVKAQPISPDSDLGAPSDARAEKPKVAP